MFTMNHESYLFTFGTENSCFARLLSIGNGCGNNAIASFRSTNPRGLDLIVVLIIRSHRSSILFFTQLEMGVIGDDYNVMMGIEFIIVAISTLFLLN